MGPRFSIIAWGRRRSINSRNSGTSEQEKAATRGSEPPTPPIAQGHPPVPCPALDPQRAKQRRAAAESGVTVSDDAERQKQARGENSRTQEAELASLRVTDMVERLIQKKRGIALSQLREVNEAAGQGPSTQAPSRRSRQPAKRVQRPGPDR